MVQKEVKIIADTNILVRAIVGDDPTQSAVAKKLLLQADLVAIPAIVLCELCWVLTQSYRIARNDVIAAIQGLASSENVAIDESAVAAGAVLKAGGDFADGAIDENGQWLGGEVFVSFDWQALDLLEGAGRTIYRPDRQLRH